MTYKSQFSNSTAADPCTVTISGINAGDFLIAWAVTDSSAVGFATPSGFTLALESAVTFDNQVYGCWYKKAAGGETSVVFDHTLSAPSIGAVMVFEDIDATTQLDVTPQAFSSSTGSTDTDISITPVTNGCDIVFAQGQDGNSSDYTFTFSTISGTTGAWTTRTDIWDGGFRNAGGGSAVQTTAGALTARCVSTNGGRTGVLFALRPAAGGGGATLMGQAAL